MGGGGAVKGIAFAQDRSQWLNLVNTIMSFRFYTRRGISWLLRDSVSGISLLLEAEIQVSQTSLCVNTTNN